MAVCVTIAKRFVTRSSPDLASVQSPRRTRPAAWLRFRQLIADNPLLDLRSLLLHFTSNPPRRTVLRPIRHAIFYVQPFTARFPVLPLLYPVHVYPLSVHMYPCPVHVHHHHHAKSLLLHIPRPTILFTSCAPYSPFGVHPPPQSTSKANPLPISHPPHCTSTPSPLHIRPTLRPPSHHFVQSFHLKVRVTSAWRPLNTA